MKYLIYGAGTIGITYAWLLSRTNDVHLLVKPERFEEISNGVNLGVKDLRNKSGSYEKMLFYPHCVTEVTDCYDGILATVNRCQLKSILPKLAAVRHLTKYFAFMQNNWNIQAEITPYIPENRFIIAFPSSVGGGRDSHGIEVILFDEATRLGGQCRAGADDLGESLKQVQVKTKYDPHIYDWLKVHYLQQSITAGAVLESGGFRQFAHDYSAVKKMVKAFREGIEVCRSQGIRTDKAFPADFFKLPLPIIAHTMQKMFLNPNTVEMVNNHMKKGLQEWIAGYYEILRDGLEAGLPMPVWKSYDTERLRDAAEGHQNALLFV